MIKWFKAHRNKIFALLGIFFVVFNCFIFSCGAYDVSPYDDPRDTHPVGPLVSDDQYEYYDNWWNGEYTYLPIANFQHCITMSNSSGVQFTQTQPVVPLLVEKAGSLGVNTEFVFPNYMTVRNTYYNISDMITGYNATVSPYHNFNFYKAFSNRVTISPIGGKSIEKYMITATNFVVTPIDPGEGTRITDRNIIKLRYNTAGGGSPIQCGVYFHFLGNENQWSSFFDDSDGDFDITYNKILANATMSGNPDTSPYSFGVPIVIDSMYILLPSSMYSEGVMLRTEVACQLQSERNILDSEVHGVYEATLRIEPVFGLDILFNGVSRALSVPLWGYISIGGLLATIVAILAVVAILRTYAGST